MNSRIEVPMEVKWQPAWLTWVSAVTTCLKALGNIVAHIKGTFFERGKGRVEYVISGLGAVNIQLAVGLTGKECVCLDRF